jgi:peptidoglycan/LPS O-acetylase OafA/YrhL
MAEPGAAGAGMTATRARHVLGIDLIRFAAALMVMAFHYDGAFPPERRLPFAWAGWVGVEVFFVVSGYVIAYSAEGSTPADFAKARLARLAPGAWICGTLTAASVLIAGGAAGLLGQYLRTMTLWLTGPFVDDVYWTLPIEIVFYAFVFCTLSRTRLLSLGGLIRVLAIASALWWAARAAFAAGLPNPIRAQSFAMLPPILLSLVQFGCDFALGALFRESVRDGMTARRTGLIAICVAAGVAQIGFNIPRSGASVAGWSLGAPVIAPTIIWLALVGAIGASVLGNETAWGLLGRLAGPIRAIGLVTYPLYLLHARFGTWLGHAVHVGPVTTGVLVICLSLAVAMVGEPPIRRGLRGVFAAWPSAEAR